MSLFSYEVHNRVAEILFNNPPVNALTEAIAAGQVSAIANGLPGTLTIPPSRDFEGFYIALIRKRS